MRSLGLKCSTRYVKNIYLSTFGQITRYNMEVGFGNPKLELIYLELKDFLKLSMEGCRSGLSGMS